MRRGTGRTTDGFLAAALPLLVLTAAACVSNREPGSPAPGGKIGAHYARSTEAVRQISLRKGRMGWGGLEIGMTFHQAEQVLGRRLPALGSATQDELCGTYPLEVELMDQSLRLEFSAEAGDSHLQSIWLPLTSRAGPASRDEIVAALHGRFPKLEYVPSPHAPDLSEEKNPQPLYRLSEGGGMIFVQGGGIHFGEVCVD